eukprot:6175354-Pleurochrysis_carterae.AAC.5
MNAHAHAHVLAHAHINVYARDARAHIYARSSARTFARMGNGDTVGACAAVLGSEHRSRKKRARVDYICDRLWFHSLCVCLVTAVRACSSSFSVFFPLSSRRDSFACTYFLSLFLCLAQTRKDSLKRGHSVRARAFDSVRVGVRVAPSARPQAHVPTAPPLLVP